MATSTLCSSTSTKYYCPSLAVGLDLITSHIAAKHATARALRPAVTVTDDADDDDGDHNDVCLLNSQLHREVEGVASKRRRRRRRVSAGVLGRAFKALLGVSARRARGNSNQRPPHIRRTSPQQNLQVSTSQTRRMPNRRLSRGQFDVRSASEKQGIQK